METETPAAAPGDAAPESGDSTPDQGDSTPPARITGCEDCDPDLIDCLKCDAAGIDAQAKYNADHKAAMEAGYADYTKTRKDYRTTRHDVRLQVQDMRHGVKHLVERIRCLIQQDRVVDCLDRAWARVEAQLDCCPLPTGCCVDGPCEFPTDGCEGLDALKALLDDYAKHAARASDCFTRLKDEPAQLLARVGRVKDQIDAINAKLAADPATVDLKQAYAMALVARRDVLAVWGGFADTGSFVDCLCEALTCWTKANAAVSELTRLVAVEQCRKDEQEARCTELRTHTVDEILVCYEKECPPKCDDDSHDHDGDHHEHDDDHDNHDDDCGCGGKHHHKHHHHHHHHDDDECSDEDGESDDESDEDDDEDSDEDDDSDDDSEQSGSRRRTAR